MFSCVEGAAMTAIPVQVYCCTAEYTSTPARFTVSSSVGTDDACTRLLACLLWYYNINSTRTYHTSHERTEIRKHERKAHPPASTSRSSSSSNTFRILKIFKLQPAAAHLAMQPSARCRASRAGGLQGSYSTAASYEPPTAL